MTGEELEGRALAHHLAERVRPSFQTWNGTLKKP